MVLMVHSSRLQRNGFNTISSQSQQRVCSPATSLLTLCMRCRRRQGRHGTSGLQRCWRMRSATRVLAGHRKHQKRRPAILELQGWLMHAMELGLELGLPNLREILDVISGVRE